MYIHVCTPIHVHIHTYMYIHVHAYLIHQRTDMYAYMYMYHVYTCTYIQYIHTHVYTCTCTCTCTYMYIQCLHVMCIYISCCCNSVQCWEYWELLSVENFLSHDQYCLYYHWNHRESVLIREVSPFTEGEMCGLHTLQILVEIEVPS